jgi:hypothetical protein
MSQKRIDQIERKMSKIQEMLGRIGPMRPGSLTCQYRNPREHTGPYWQISYTRRMKSHTEYVRPEWVPDIRRQIASYKRLMSLIERWIDLSIERSKLQMQIAKQAGSK